MLVVLFFMPVMQTILFGLALTNEVKNVQLAVFASPSDYTAQKIRTKALASGWFKTVKNVDFSDFSNIENTIMSNKAEAILVAPQGGFPKAIEGQKSLQLLIDATNASRARQVEAYVKAITMEVVQEQSPNFPVANLIEIDSRVLFNHTLDTAPFMIPAIIAMASFMVTMLICCMAITKEKEQGTMEKLISSPVTSLEIILGKTVPYAIVGITLICFIVFVGVIVFEVPLRGNFWQILVTGILFILTALSIAMFVSTITKSQ
jgi:ABC-2 type transport system permease protein